MSRKRHNIVTGLDIGTTKICAVMAEIRDGKAEVIAIGEAPSHGLRKGVVINIESTVSSIKEAIQDAERMAGSRVESVYAGIAGGHIRGFNSHGIVAISGNEVSQSDIDRVIDAAKTVALPADRDVIHIIPQEYIVDDQDGIRDPIGMCGRRLEAKIHIVTGAVTSAQNIVKCAHKCGLSVNDIVLEQLASGLAVLSDDEKELGVGLIDIGGGTTDIALFRDGAIQHTSVIAIGGRHLTNDIAVGLRTPQTEAEKIKRRFGTAVHELVQAGDMIEVPRLGTQKNRILNRDILVEILRPRVEEIFDLVNREIDRIRYAELLASGIVLTGGTTLLPGMAEVAEEILGLPVRIGLPDRIEGLRDELRNPMYATGVGLVRYGIQDRMESFIEPAEQNMYSRVRQRMGSWLHEMF